jgi:myb proto-oncogene protein
MDLLGTCPLIQEDEAICKLVSQYGLNDWTKIASKLKENYWISCRTGKQCRERWYNHLNPAVNKKPWNLEEESRLFELHKVYGNRWKDISKCFVGRYQSC